MASRVDRVGTLRCGPANRRSSLTASGREEEVTVIVIAVSVMAEGSVVRSASNTSCSDTRNATFAAAC